MKLSEYFKTLNKNDIIDHCIVQTIMNAPFTLEQSIPYVCHSSVGNNNYMFTYVRWVKEHLCLGEIINYTELLSTRFSGCYLALFEDSGIQYGCHIHRTTGDISDQKEHWNNYVRYLPKQNVIIFQPNIGWCIENPHYNATNDLGYMYDIWGIINANKKCYSILVRSTSEFIASLYDSQYRADVKFIELKECWAMNSSVIP
ncbi:hypothetical protein POZ24_18975 [Bacteroides uniformis]|uniref:Uncharacterized protein n=1 Tax=Bacteroides uniformis TaxID=820 RepID=A0AAW6GU14_BACUN|nr:hypothetical protein [Bacteroides uniformis]MDC1882074.1 hypothetical protein [Bacteroides uniformis]MDC1886017.1 hypothetical protein [Bacteroides uniformis]